MSSIFRFSELADRMQPSPIRELFQMIRQPGMISFAGGLPDPSAFPVGPFADCADVLSRDGREVLQYGASEGYPPLREILLEMMADRLGYEVRRINSSSPRDRSRGRTWWRASFSTRATWSSSRPRPTRGRSTPCATPERASPPFPAMPRGCRSSCCRRSRREVETATGRRPKLIYTVPDFSNPSGACMSLERRQSLVEPRRRSRDSGPRGRSLRQAPLLRQAPCPTSRSWRAQNRR